MIYIWLESHLVYPYLEKSALDQQEATAYNHGIVSVQSRSYFRHLRAILAYHRHPSHDVVILRIQPKEPCIPLTNAKHAIYGKQKAFVLLVHCGFHTAVIQRLNNHCLFTAHLFHIADDGALEFATDGVVCSAFATIACTRCNFIPGKALRPQLDCQGDTLLRVQIERCHLWVVRLLVALWVVDLTHRTPHTSRYRHERGTS